MHTKDVAGSIFTIDPLDHYKRDADCMEACGLLLEWLWEAAEFGTDPDEGHPLLHVALQESYTWFDKWLENEAEVVDQKFCYPEDPALFPLLSVVRSDEAIYIYPHAIVAVVIGGKTKWTRMD